MRLFFALSFPQEVIAYLTNVQRDLRRTLPDTRGLSWPAPENMHLTLEFLGDMEPLRVRDLSDAARTVTAAVPSFDAQLHGAGAFPSLERAAVLWCGVGTGREAIVSMQAALRHALRAQRVKTENRRYQPHVTLARVRTPLGPEALRQSLWERPPSPVWRVSSMDLIESRLLPSGARYTPVERFPLYMPATDDVE